jgi:C_GCAxxG_C_C family probable redox protein
MGGIHIDEQMMELQEKIVTLSKVYNCNCAESVIRVMAERFHFDEGLTRMGTVFGSGVSGNADLCGYLTGGLLVISLKFGRVDCDDKEKKSKCYRAGNEYFQWFMDSFGRCCDIKGDPTKGPYDECHAVGRKCVPKLVEIIEGFSSL